MLNVVIVDDEKPALNLLGKMLAEYGDVRVTGAFTKPSELLGAMPELMPDAVFLDIEMPGINGLELALQLQEMNEEVEVVFVTAYRQYALGAFQVNAIDYLLKPVDASLLERTVARLAKKKGQTVKRTGASSILCFGGLEVRRPDRQEPVRFPTSKAEELLALFLVHRGTAISKWAICETLWPDIAPDKIEQILHTTVYRLKKTLTENGIPIRLSSRRGLYWFEYDGACDYIRFGLAMDECGDSCDERQTERLEEALRLYKGSLFGGKDYMWCEAERERVFRQYAGKSKMLASAYAQANEQERAIELLQNLIMHAPLDEAAYELLLSVYFRKGDRNAFLVHYEKLELLLKNELGLEPGAEVKLLQKQLLKQRD